MVRTVFTVNASQTQTVPRHEGPIHRSAQIIIIKMTSGRVKEFDVANKQIVVLRKYIAPFSGRYEGDASLGHRQKIKQEPLVQSKKVNTECL